MLDTPNTLKEKTIETLMAEADYCNFLKYYCGADVDAYLFITAYTVYVHAIDDIIDKDNTDPVFILKTFELAAIVYGNSFYLRHFSALYPLVKMASSTYITSVQLEQDKDKAVWKDRVADALRQTGNELILAVIEILHGIDKRIEASLKLRKISWKTHHKEDGTPC